MVWRAADAAIDVFVLRDGTYVPHVPAAKRCYQSESLPGLWLDVDAILRGEMRKVDAVLRKGLASAKHAAFVKRLARAASAGRRS